MDRIISRVGGPRSSSCASRGILKQAYDTLKIPHPLSLSRVTRVQGKEIRKLMLLDMIDYSLTFLINPQNELNLLTVLVNYRFNASIQRIETTHGQLLAVHV